MYITEPEKKIPIINDVDLCVLGGSCTGAFAAIRAARLGLKVALVELSNCFGGVATNAFVAVWHPLLDTTFKKQIVAGLTEEVLDLIPGEDKWQREDKVFYFNPMSMKYALDKLVRAENIDVYFHTMYTGVSLKDDDTIDCVFVENKNGRSAIRAKFFVDATGDGDVCRDLGIERYVNDNVQPPSYTFLTNGDVEPLYEKYPGFNSDVITKLANDYCDEYGMEHDFGWGIYLPGGVGARFNATTHTFGRFCGEADQLTDAEFNGREKAFITLDILRRHGGKDAKFSIIGDCSVIGVRDSYHYKTKYQANYLDLLLGKRYEDNICNGTYNIDIHDKEAGVTFMGFDGNYTFEDTNGNITHGSWRKEKGIDLSLPIPTYYSLPFRTLVGEKYTNFIAAGRMMNADEPSFGALRVMTNLNQIGEAAGVGAYIAINENKTIQDVDGKKVAKTLSDGGSANLD